MLDYDTWMKVKTECHNEAQVSFQRLSLAAQTEMKKAHEAGAIIETLMYAGKWMPGHDVPGWHPGIIARVNPSWPGPAKPEPVAEYEDRKVELSGDGTIYIYSYQVKTNTHTRSIDSAVSNPRLAGYVMPDGKIRPRLIFNQQTDGTDQLCVPMAVRLRKEGATV